MVDMHRRRNLALRLRRLASGRLHPDDYEADDRRSPDAGVREVAYFGWTLYSDWDDHLVGRRALNRDTRRMVARAVLFLHSGQEYGWPPHPPVLSWRALLRPLTFGLVGPDQRWVAWSRGVDFAVWPFPSAASLAAAASRQPFGPPASAAAA